jgi:hypothetical protein
MDLRENVALGAGPLNDSEEVGQWEKMRQDPAGGHEVRWRAPLPSRVRVEG